MTKLKEIPRNLSYCVGEYVLIAIESTFDDSDPSEIAVLESSPSGAYVKIRFIIGDNREPHWVTNDKYTIVEVLTNNHFNRTQNANTPSTPPDR